MVCDIVASTGVFAVCFIQWVTRLAVFGGITYALEAAFVLVLVCIGYAVTYSLEKQLKSHIALVTSLQKKEGRNKDQGTLVKALKKLRTIKMSIVIGCCCLCYLSFLGYSYSSVSPGSTYHQYEYDPQNYSLFSLAPLFIKLVCVWMLQWFQGKPKPNQILGSRSGSGPRGIKANTYVRGSARVSARTSAQSSQVRSTQVSNQGAIAPADAVVIVITPRSNMRR
jgi:hypothetical protein